MYDLNYYLNEVNTIVDKLNHPIDEGIARSVAILRYKGFNTNGSCQGHIDHGLSYPWIDIDCYNIFDNEKQRNKIDEILLNYPNKNNITIQPFGIFKSFRICGSDLKVF